MKNAEMNVFRERLLALRARLRGDVNRMADAALKKNRAQANGDLSSMPIHMADLGSDNFEQEFTLELLDSERKVLVEIEDALKRIEEGTFGICEGTGKPIERSRLEAIPWARYSVEYANQMEKGIGRKSESTEKFIPGFATDEEPESEEEEYEEPAEGTKGHQEQEEE